MDFKEMKAISLWQPHASLMQTGAKQIETRSWKTNYRGPLLICSAKGGLSVKQFNYTLSKRLFQFGLAELVEKGLKVKLKKAYSEISKKIPYGKTFSSEFDFHPVKREHLPFGKALCVVDLVDVVPTESLVPQYELLVQDEIEFGDFSDNRFAWITKNRRPIKPVPITGRQGLFNPPSELIDKLEYIELPEAV